MENTEALKHLFTLMDTSISFSDAEILQLKAYVLLKPEKVDAMITVFEKEQEKLDEIDAEFEKNVKLAIEEKNLADQQEKLDQATSMGTAVQETIHKIQEEELKSESDADEYLEDMLENI